MLKFLVSGLVFMLPVAAAAEVAQMPDAGEKVRCKRIGETGSNARIKKICRTERQWQQLRDASKMEADALTQPTGGARTSG